MQHQSFSDMDKPLYTISVAAEILETHPRTLMLYEDAHLIEPHRTTTNRRRYSQRDISRSTGSSPRQSCAKSTIVTHNSYKREPRGVPVGGPKEDRSASPTGLLSFRYTVGTCLKATRRNDWQTLEIKSRPG